MKKRGFGQKAAFFTAIVFYTAAFACVLAVAYGYTQFGGNSPIVASFAASVVFFIGAGVVLHVIGRADLPSLRVGDTEELPPQA